MKSVLVIAIIILSGSLGDIFLARGMKQVGEVDTLNPAKLISIAWKTLSSPYIPLGIACMAIAFFSLVAVLSWEKVSIVEPATAFAYVVNTLGARFYLKEDVDSARWTGTALVALGAALLSF